MSYLCSLLWHDLRQASVPDDDEVAIFRCRRCGHTASLTTKPPEDGRMWNGGDSDGVYHL